MAHARRPVWIGLIVLTMMVSCAAHSDITPPPGWTGTPNIFGFHVQVFRNPQDLRQSIMVTRPLNPRPTSHPAKEKWTPMKICGNHPAMLMQQRAVLSGQDTQMDGVDTSWNGVRVMAMYARPYGTPADPEAEKSIRSLCGP